jgi:hypothetical protein
LPVQLSGFEGFVNHRRRPAQAFALLPGIALNIAEIRRIDHYDAYYLDRRHQRPLPVVLVQLND